MEKKICTNCNVEKLIEQFAWHKKTLGVRKYQCKACDKIKRKSYYAENKSVIIKKVYQQNIKTKVAIQQYVWDYWLAHPCIDCGETDPIVLEFDHKINCNKIENVSRLISHSFSLEKVKEEIEKCDVRCSNCHKRKTAKQFGWYKLIDKRVL